jgi:hypothetical protein
MERHHQLVASETRGLTPIEEGDQSMFEGPAAEDGIDSARNVNRAKLPRRVSKRRGKSRAKGP